MKETKKEFVEREMMELLKIIPDLSEDTQEMHRKCFGDDYERHLKKEVAPCIKTA